MKIFVVADIYGELSKLDKIINIVEKKKPNLVVCPGNFTDMFKTHNTFSQLDVGEVVVQKLLSLGKPLFCVPGNHDPPQILDVFNEYGINLHTKKHIFNKKVFGGFGGANTPFKTNFEPTEEETTHALKKMEDIDVLVTHNPPKNTEADKIKSGEHVGSDAVRKFILNKKPLLIITAHIPEAFGTGKLGNTTIFNPGACFDGRYGIVEIDKKLSCRLLKT